jgi:hypothetical protein
MAEHIDQMTFTRAGSLLFTVNTAVDMVDAIHAGVDSYKLKSASGLGLFEPDDSFTIESYGYRMPLGFQTISKPSVPAEIITQFELSAYDGTQYYYFPEVGHNSVIYAPMDNFEVGCGIFIDMASRNIPSTRKYFLRLRMLNFHVSMLNLPSNLNTTSQAIIPFIKIIHNKDLTF